jgi:hypothetical protein
MRRGEWRNLRVEEDLEDPDLDGKVILKCILEKWEVGAWTGSIWLRIGTSGGFL